VVSCPGAESCKLAVTQSRGLGQILTEHLDTHPEFASLAQEGDIKISGCPNGCGQHHIAAIGFQGSVRKLGSRALPQYFVLVGGGATESGAKFGRQSATRWAAELMGWEDRVGSLAPGLYADLVAVNGNPLDDITTLESPSSVMKGGVWVNGSETP
jgi:hypothetical protein